MKHVVLFFALSFSFLTFGQTPSSEWLLSVGVNTINNLGTQNPIKSPDKWVFKTPFAINAERVLDNRFALDFGISFNSYKKGDQLDGTTSIDESYTYFSFDPSVKYYFGDVIFPEFSRFHLYGIAGPGFFFIDESNVTFNAGGGMLVWLDKNHSFGLKLQSLAKFAIDNTDERFENNHFQYHAQLVISL